jgi:hypothetical protein
VWFHVIIGAGGAGNVTNAQISQQMAVVNKAYAPYFTFVLQVRAAESKAPRKRSARALCLCAHARACMHACVLCLLVCGVHAAEAVPPNAPSQNHHMPAHTYTPPLHSFRASHRASRAP